MFFQITPPKPQKLDSKSSSETTVKNFFLKLRPFQPQTHITINTPINTTAEAFLTLQNEQSIPLKLLVTKESPIERGVELNSKECFVEPNHDYTLTIQWHPKKPGRWRDTLQMMDNRRLKYDVPLILNAHDPAANTKRKKFTLKKPLSTFSAFSKTTTSTISKRPRSPVPKENKENEDSNVPFEIRRNKKSKKETFSTFSAIMNDNFQLTPVRLKSPSSSLKREEKFDGPKPNFFIPDETNQDLRRKTYGILKIESNKPENFNESLEADFSVLVNQVNFTPKSTTFVFSPEGCSTAQKTNVNETFEIADCSASPGVNRTYELSPSTMSFSEPLSIIQEERTLNKTRTLEPVKEKKVNKFVISPPSNRGHNVLKVSPTKRGRINKEKRKVNFNKSIKDGGILVPGARIGPLSLSGVFQQRNFAKLNNSANASMIFSNPDAFGATTTEDPFLFSNVYYDEKWIHQQEVELTKWLNALLTAPENLTTDDTVTVDVGQIWQSCRQKDDVVLAETKEAISARYHTNTRLDTLRKAAVVMFHKPEMSTVLSKTISAIDKGVFTIRGDCNLHRDIGLQKCILELFLSYNPLWLRIGLETIYGEKILLSSNSDLVGLTRFLITRFFSDPQLVKTHSVSSNASLKKPQFQPLLNKFIMKKFLSLVYFLDDAKSNKLIGHDPCLFHRKASIKDSRNILLSFSRQVLSGIGDVTKVLKPYGYIVRVQQNYLEEYNFALVDISSDLRDGVRLCRTMELITGEKNIVKKCRAPAISRLQKVHNVELSLAALRDAGYILTGDINARNIADGYREKTLSLLWQIINKFQKPRFQNAAIAIQRWWRSKFLIVRVRRMLKFRKEEAACVIQKHWRGYLTRKIFHREKQARSEAVLKIQRFWTKRRRQIQDARIENTTMLLQRWWRNTVQVKPFVEDFRQRREAAIIIQRFWKTVKQRRDFLRLRKAARRITAIFRGRRIREDYLRKMGAVIVFQRRWRLIVENRKKIEAICVIQQWWKSTLQRNQERDRFLLIKAAVRVVESRWIAKKKMNAERKKFLFTKEKIVFVQRLWRSVKSGKIQRSEFLEKKEAALKIQRKWRATLCARNERKLFLRKKEGATKIQTFWRMMSDSRKFAKMRKSAITIQSLWRSAFARKTFLRKRKAAVIIQSFWRMRVASKQSKMRKNAIIVIQKRWREVVLSRVERKNFLRLKKAVVKIQSLWRARQEMKRFLALKSTVIFVQRRFQANKLSRVASEKFVKLRKSVILVQKIFQAKRILRKLRIEKVTLEKEKARKVEEMKIEKAALKIQAIWKGYKVRKAASDRILELRSRTEKATREAVPSSTLAYKLQESIAVLKMPNTVGQLTMTFCTLDSITRLSPECCQSLSCLSDSIIDAMTQFNRSLPWNDACLGAANVLINLVKHHGSKNAVIKVEHAKVLAKLLFNTCEKHVELFLHVSTLLWLLIDKAEDVKLQEIMSNSDIDWFLRRTNESVGKIKSKPLSASLKQQKFALPCRYPDWHLRREPRLFSSPRGAINAIFQHLKKIDQ